MGKRAKKKVQRGISGRSAAALGVSPLTLSASSPAPPLEGGCSTCLGDGKGNGPGCRHGPNLEKLRAQLAKLTQLHCIGCAKLRSGASSGRDRKGRAQIAKKKTASALGAVDYKGRLHKLWVCLSCGHVGCGLGNPKLAASAIGEIKGQGVKQGVVGPGHAWQHWLQLKHPVVMLCDENFSTWCFACEEAHEMQRAGDDSARFAARISSTGEEASAAPSTALLFEEAKAMVQEKLSEEVGHVEFRCVRRTEGSENEDGVQSSIAICGHDESPGPPPSRRAMKGLVNLGNTCFLNSVLQNLLSVEALRRHFESPSPVPEGVLTGSLRKFFEDAGAQSPGESDGALGTGTKKAVRTRAGWSSMDEAYNPKGLFSAICLKAPRFKGSQQQDSHELFKTLLDVLHGEEETSWRASSKCGAGEEGLRALSKSGDLNALTQIKDRYGELASVTEFQEESATEPRNGPSQPETFVERVFGGQLSSTVTCCECGHSSVKYESFLDLSLPIPATKVSERNSASHALSSGVKTRSQKAQALRHSRASHKADASLDTCRSVPAGLGSPLLLLPAPPPPPKEDMSDSAIDKSTSEDAWLDYMGPVVEPSDTDWLEHVDVNPSISSSYFIEGSSRTTPEQPLTRFESQTTHRSISTSNFNLDSTFVSDTERIQQESDTQALSSNGSGTGDFERYCTRMEQESNSRKATSDILVKRNVLHHDLDARCTEKMSVLQGVPALIGEDKNAETGLASMPSEEGDVRVLMRGGSSRAGFHSTSDSLQSDGRSIDTSASSEQLGTLNANAELPSDIIDGPNGPVILLGGPVADDATAIAGLNLSSDGEFDGIDALFTEVETMDEGQEFGPALPSRDDELGLDESAYEDVIFHDVLDLSTLCIDGRTDWLVSHDEKEDEGIDRGEVSVESCLQTFTKLELLSGENAWECDNCAKRYHDTVAATMEIVPPPIDVEETYEEPETGLSPGHSPDGRVAERGNDGNACAKLPSSSTLENGVQRSVNVGFENWPSEAAHSSPSCNAPVSASFSSSTNKAGANGAKLEERHGNVQGLGSNSADKIGNPPDRSVLAPLNLNNLEVEMESGGRCSSHEMIPSLATQVTDSASGKDRKGTMQDTRAATNRSAQDCPAGKLVAPLKSGKSAESERAEQQTLVGERNTAIKRDATKRFLISKAPLVLTVQLKRFAQDMRGRLSKLSGHVAFQEFLDLHPFLDHRSKDFNFKYRLVGTVEHTGTLRSGHYVAFVRGSPPTEISAPKVDQGSLSSELSSWYHISDERVCPTSLEAVLQREAYLVFYEKVYVENGSS